MRVLTKAEMIAVAEDLQGTCRSIAQAIECVTDGELTDEDDVVNYKDFYATIDNNVFECAECGWWCESGDYADIQPDPANGDICTDCGKNHDDEEDE